MKVLIIIGVLVIVAMAAYAAYLWLKVYRQKQQAGQAQDERRRKLAQSIDLIAMAMAQGQCNLSEGVLRLKPLIESAGLDFSRYPAMNKLHEVVADMPILAERRQLKRNERMKLDLIRESSEAELESEIVAEAVNMRQAVEAWLPKQANQ
ncbi:DUF2489 domain-containing protein [Neisseria sp. N95_16]|uniref:DUF2489 domain-containing protein n=1 Tax=Neisseria brasiliensis TaxID=2666100 RepID=A0A7X2GWR3_9NEIS|nr:MULTISPECIES: DUF2489 domain-containing protein [Neisseria]MRN37259.1 DUF2489 domain-containing protein [Neisseria brasiliensis]PJO10037.1 DUF2489 domain-containing protein [Neisseria sp. N95_16]